jgi:hypothetical protein
VFTGINRYVYAPIAALALWAVVLAVSPGMANAQATHQSQGQQRIAVVNPGDSLWSISARWLGPDATAQQIADGVERIYALNKDRIGPDLNLIFVGQRLVLPSAAPRHLSDAANNESGNPTGSTPAEANREPRQSADARPEAPSLPEPARDAAVPTVGSLSPDDSSPSLSQSVASEARSFFSSIVAEVRGAIPRGEYSGSKLLGAALMGMSSVLATILVLHVAKELWGPRYARRRAQAHWGSGYASADYAWSPDLLFWDSGQVKRGKSIPRLPLRSYVAPRDELPGSRTPVAHSANGKPSSDALHKIARARRQLRNQSRKAKRPLRAPAKVVARGVRREQVVRRAPISRANRARTLRRAGGR